MDAGEKLHEEVSLLLEDTVPTAHEKIRMLVGTGVPTAAIHCCLDTLQEVCTARDTTRLMMAFTEIVPDYNPSTDLLKRILLMSVASNPVLQARFLPASRGLTYPPQ